MVNWRSQSKTPPQSPEDGHIYCILFIRIAFYHVSKNLPLHCLFDVTISISVFYINTARDIVTVLLIFAKYLSLHLHIFICTYRCTHTQTHMYNQHTRGTATTRHISRVERGGRKTFVIDKGLAHTTKKGEKQCQEKPISTNLKKTLKDSST